MNLHLPTLLLLDICVLALLGGLMLHAWWRSESESTLGYMAGLLLLGSLGALVLSLRGIGIDTLSMVFGNLLLRLAVGMGWASVRVFAGRRPHWLGICGGALAWALLCLWPEFHRSLPLRVTLGTLLTVFYAILGAWELWSARSRIEVSVIAAVTLFLWHALLCSVLLVLYRGQTMVLMWSGADDPFLAWRFLETFLFAIGIAFVTMAMVRERAELRFRAVANRDPLTDIGNRRAFMDGAQARLADCQRSGSAAALLLCDLDYFKRLNDSHGHAMGDAALVAFGHLLARSVRQGDVCGRIGGEEFACLLPDADAAVAVQVAERIRRECAELQLPAEVHMSVSIGVAASEHAGYELAPLLAQADEALYRAKAAGRDRVEHYAGVPRQARGGDGA